MIKNKKAILVQSCYTQLNGTEFEVISTDINDVGETIVETNISHPECPNVNLWVNISETNLVV